ncbi:MAG: hypothetical protein ACI9WR_001312, partial [Paracoccaceae bacterium]
YADSTRRNVKIGAGTVAVKIGNNQADSHGQY